MIASYLFAVLVLCPTVLFAQDGILEPRYIPHAELTRKDGMLTIHVSSPRPVEQAVSALRRDYGLVLSYEEGPEYSSERLRLAGDRHQLKGGDVSISNPEPKGSTMADEGTFLQSVLARFEQSGAGSFTVLTEDDQRLTVAPSEPALRILDTLIVVPPERRSIDAAVNQIITAVAKEAGVTLVRAGMIDNDLISKPTTAGSTTPVKARTLLAQALNDAYYGKLWILTWEPDTNVYALSTRTAIKVEATITGIDREIPIASSHR